MELIDDPETSWHLRRLVGMDIDALAAEWQANSVHLRWPAPEGFKLDLRLSKLARGLRPYRLKTWEFAGL